MGGLLLKLRRIQRDPNVVAMLSLYLLLLAFFILLNALSKLEDDRTRTVLESVKAAFDGRVESLASVKSYPAALGNLEDGGGLIGELEKLFHSTIPAALTETSADGAVMRLTFDADALFRPGSGDLRSGRNLLLQRLTEVLLKELGDGKQFELELLHGIPETGAAVVAEAGARSLEVHRMGVLVDVLQSGGLPAKRLSIGINPGHPGVVQLVIRVLEAPGEPIDLGPRGK